MNKENSLLISWDSNGYEFVPVIASPLLNGFFTLRMKMMLANPSPVHPAFSSRSYIKKEVY